MLSLFLASESINLDIEELLKNARLSAQEKLVIFGKYAQKLLMYNPSSTSLSPMVEDMVKLYIESFTVKMLLSSDSESLLEVLDRDNRLSRELRERVNQCYLAGQAVSFGRNQGLSNAFDEKDLNVIGKVILQLGLSADRQYMGQLYRSMMLSVWDAEVDRKADRLQQLLQGLCTLTGRQSRRELLKYLLGYVKRYPTRAIPPTELLPYVEVALIYTTTFYKNFQQGEGYILDLLKTLQEHLRANMEFIDAQGSRNWTPDMWKVWLRASASSTLNLRPKNLGQRFANLNPFREKREPVGIELPKSSEDKKLETSKTAR